MASFCIRQSGTYLNVGRGTSPYILCNNDSNFPPDLPKFLTNEFITPELQDTYLALRQAEIDAVQARKAWLTQLASDLSPKVESYLKDFPETHPEAYL